MILFALRVLTVATLALTLVAGCSEEAPAGDAAGDAANDAAGAPDSAAPDGQADAGELTPDVIALDDGTAKPDGGTGEPDADEPDAAADSAGADTAGGSDDTDGWDAGPDSDAAEDAQAGCDAAITHAPVAQAPIGAIVVQATVEGTATLHYRRRLPGAPFESLPMGTGGPVSATIPESAVTFAGIEYFIESTGGCTVRSPEGAPAELHTIAIYGTMRITSEPDVYDYLPDVSGHRVVFAKEEKGGTADNVYLFDLHTFETTKLTNTQKPQGNAKISGSTVIWVDGRNSKNEWDPNQDIYLRDLTKNLEWQVTTDEDAQYGPSLDAHIIAWRDDRHMTGPINGEIYLYDMGADGAFGTADDIGELRLTEDPHDQTAPSVDVREGGRAVVVWADLRDDEDGICDALCDWNVYLHDAGPDLLFGTADDVGPVQVTSQKDEQTSPVVEGRRIAWLDASSGNWMDPDIHVYDMGPDAIFGTADDLGEQTLPVDVQEPDHLVISKNRMVYEDFRAGNWEVWLWDFAAGTEMNLTEHDRGQFYPRIDGRTVVWQDARNNDPDGEPFDDIWVRVLPDPDLPL